MVSPDPKSAPQLPDVAELYRHSASIGLDSVKDQVTQLDSMRGRAMQYLAFIGTATAFLVGTAVKGTTFSLALPTLGAILASLGILAILLLMRSLLMGTKHWWGGKVMDWNFRQKPEVYIEWLDSEGAPAKVTYYRFLANLYGEQAEKNELYLDVIRRRYIAFLWGGMLTLVAWGLLAWVYGGAGV